MGDLQRRQRALAHGSLNSEWTLVVEWLDRLGHRNHDNPKPVPAGVRVIALRSGIDTAEEGGWERLREEGQRIARISVQQGMRGQGRDGRDEEVRDPVVTPEQLWPEEKPLGHQSRSGFKVFRRSTSSSWQDQEEELLEKVVKELKLHRDRGGRYHANNGWHRVVEDDSGLHSSLPRFILFALLESHR